MAPTYSEALGRQTQGDTSAHGRHGYGSRPILPAPAGKQEVQLTSGQQQALDLLAPIFRGEVASARAVLTGFAGTGKSFLAARLINLALAIPGALGERGDGGKWKRPPAVVIATPTHKAARQLERAMAGYGIEAKAVTLHSALGLRPVRNEDKQIFLPDPKAQRLIGGNTVLVVVDETSMVSAQLARLLEEAMPPDASLVAIGDPAQLQPVGDPSPCPFFKAPIQAHLSEVVRHAGPILSLATATRERGSGRPAYSSRQGSQSSVVSYAGFSAWRRAALQACNNANRAGNTDGARVLCWTNGSADKFNRELHQEIYGPKAPPYVVGQPVVSSDVILGPDGLPVAGSTCEMRLTSVTPGRGCVDGDEIREVREKLLGKRKTQAGELLPAWDYWEIKAEIAGARDRVSFSVLSPGLAADWRGANNAIAALAKAEKAAKNEAGAKEFWRLFWRRKDRFAVINPVWAMTVHKAQGSTFERVFLHPDLDRNPAPAELNQLAYVGITRASKALHVVAEGEVHLNEARALEVAA
jgi:exodeoxyribonuclease-5